MKRLSRILLTGLITILPLVGTIYLVYWLASSTETFLGRILRVILPDAWYRPGLGMALGLVIVFLVGLFMRTVVVRKIFAWWESLLLRVPMIKSIYGAFKDVTAVFAGSRTKGEQQVVAVQIGDLPFKLIGFITRSDLRGLPPAIGKDERVAVYLPMSYQIGGYTVFVPRRILEPLDLSVEEAMRIILTAGGRQQQSL